MAKMDNEESNILDEAGALSDVKNSIAKLCKKYISGSFFDKLVDSSGIGIAKEILLDDLKEIVGHGTSTIAAKKFSNAIENAKTQVAVDTVLANYMLAGDGMNSRIGYSEAVEQASEVETFRKFLAESRCEGKCKEEKKEGKKRYNLAEMANLNKPTDEQLEEALEVAMKAGYRVILPEEIAEATEICEKAGYKVKKKGCCGDDCEFDEDGKKKEH